MSDTLIHRVNACRSAARLPGKRRGMARRRYRDSMMSSILRHPPLLC